MRRGNLVFSIPAFKEIFQGLGDGAMALAANPSKKEMWWFEFYPMRWRKSTVANWELTQTFHISPPHALLGIKPEIQQMWPKRQQKNNFTLTHTCHGILSIANAGPNKMTPRAPSTLSGLSGQMTNIWSLSQKNKCVIYIRKKIIL